MNSTARHIAAIALCALTAVTAAWAENGPTPFNFRVKLDPNSQGTVVPPLTPNDPDETIVVTINGPINGQVATPFQMTSSASGPGAKAWSLDGTSGSLPPGLDLDASTGSITGQTNSAGPSPVIVLRAQNAAGAHGKSPPFRLNFLTQGQTATASYGGPYAGSVGATYAGGGTSSGLTAPVTWTVSSGTLPPGLELAPATGQVSGIPTTAGTYAGISLYARGANGVGVATQTFQIAVAGAPTGGSLSVAMPDITTRVGRFVSRTAVAYGGTPSLVTNHDGAMPQGLTANSATVSGVPTTPGTYTGLTAVAHDQGGATAQQPYTITVLPAEALSISYSTPATTSTEYPYSLSPTVIGSSGALSYALVAGTIPPGLGLDPNSGRISGTPTTPGTYPGIIVRAVGADGREAANPPATINVVPATPLRATVYSQTVARGVESTVPVHITGTKAGPYTVTLNGGTLPAGMSVSGQAITGLTTDVGYHGNITVRVRSADGTEAISNTFYLNVIGTGVIEVVMPEEIPPGTVGQRYDHAFSVRGQNGTGPVTSPITWRLLGSSMNAIPLGPPNGSLAAIPSMPGMSIDQEAGAIVGVPTAPFESTTLYMQATDGTGRTGTSLNFKIAARHPFTLAWNTEPYTSPKPTMKKNAYYSAYTDISPAPQSSSFFGEWFYRKPWSWAYRSWERTGTAPDLTVNNGGVVSGYVRTAGTYTIGARATDARGMTRETPPYTLKVLESSYIDRFDPVEMYECGGSGGDNYLFGGTWTSVNGRAVWTGRTNNLTRPGAGSSTETFPSPAHYGTGFEFQAKVEGAEHHGGTIKVTVLQHRLLWGKIQLGNLLDPSDNGWLYVEQTHPGNMPDFGHGKRSIFGVYGNISAAFGEAGEFTESIVLKDWRTGEDIPYNVTVKVLPRNPPICGFTVTF